MTLVKFITKDKCLETHIYIKTYVIFTYKQSECSIIWGGKGKREVFEEALKGRAWLKVGHCGPESLRSDFNFINVFLQLLRGQIPKVQNDR